MSNLHTLMDFSIITVTYRNVPALRCMLSTLAISQVLPDKLLIFKTTCSGMIGPEINRLIQYIRAQGVKVGIIVDDNVSAVANRCKLINLVSTPWVLIADDDILIKSLPTSLAGDDVMVTLGSKPDCCNFEGYPDYELISDKPSNHSFWNVGDVCQDEDAAPVVNAKGFIGDMGFLMVRTSVAQKYLPLVEDYVQSHPEVNRCVCDDMMAQFLCEVGKATINNQLACLHTGNSNTGKTPETLKEHRRQYDSNYSNFKLFMETKGGITRT